MYVLKVTLGEKCCLREPQSTAPGCKSCIKTSLPREVNVILRQSARSEELSLLSLWRHVVLVPRAVSGEHQGKIGELCLKNKAAAVELYVTAV